MIFGAVCFLLGILPTLYLFYGTNEDTLYTYLKVHSLREYFYVLFREGYGTFHLASQNYKGSPFDTFVFLIKGFLKNSNYLNLVFFYSFSPALIGL